MPSKLPFEYTSPAGEHFDLNFRLHSDCVSAMRVSQLLNRLLETLDQEIGVLGDTANGDVLQALAMALAVRVGMIHADRTVTHRLCDELLREALTRRGRSPARPPPVGPCIVPAHDARFRLLLTVRTTPLCHDSPAPATGRRI
jgi:hypothetical protein